MIWNAVLEAFLFFFILDVHIFTASISFPLKHSKIYSRSHINHSALTVNKQEQTSRAPVSTETLVLEQYTSCILQVCVFGMSVNHVNDLRL